MAESESGRRKFRAREWLAFLQTIRFVEQVGEDSYTKERRLRKGTDNPVNKSDRAADILPNACGAVGWRRWGPRRLNLTLAARLGAAVQFCSFRPTTHRLCSAQSSWAIEVRRGALASAWCQAIQGRHKRGRGWKMARPMMWLAPQTPSQAAISFLLPSATGNSRLEATIAACNVKLSRLRRLF